MSKEIFCDPKIRAVGKPAVGKIVGSLLGTAIGCASSGSRCSPARQIASGAFAAALGYTLGAAWDDACKK